MRTASFLFEAKNIRYYNETGFDIAAGDVVPMSTMCGVALVDIADGGYGTVTIEGAFSVPAVNDTAFTVGDKVYWDATNLNATTTSTDNTPLGVVIEDKAETTAKAKVKLLLV